MRGTDRYEASQPYPGLFRIVCPGWHPGPGSIPGYGTAIVTVVVGREYALVLDTGYGDPGLRECVASLTDRRPFVVNTHAHPDHVAGNAEFDEAWIHPADIAAMELFCPSVDAAGRRRYAVNELADGQVFDLGGRALAVHRAPGHTAGSCVLLDLETGVLLSGDTVLKRMLIQASRLEFLASLRRLARLEFTAVLGAHWPHDLGRAQIERGIRLLEDYRVDMETSAPWELGGKAVEFRMFHRGRDFDDPEFVAFAHASNVDIG